jgi:uncharacterized protein YhaN
LARFDQTEQLGVAAEWFEFEAEIEQIGHQASEISELRGRYSSLQLQLDEATAMISRLLEQLGLTRVTDAVREFSISMPVRRQMETLSNQYAGIESDLRQIDAKLEAANESLTSLPADHYEGPLPQNIPYLNSLLQQLAEYEQQANQLSESVQRRASQAEFVSITKRLTCQPLQLPKLAPGWAVPTTTKIANHLRQQQERQHAIGLLQQRMADIETQLTELKTESEASQLATDVGGSLQRLEQLVEQREQFLARWLDELSEPLLAASITPAVQVARLESLKETLHEMDSVQRSLLDAADFVAEGNQRALRQKVLAADQEDCAQQLEKQQLAVAEHVREWLAMWHACPFQPAHPELMNQWVQDYMRWTELFDELTELRREAHIARGMVREQRLVLQDAWPSILPSEMAFELLKDQIGQWELASRDQIRDQVRRDSMRTTKENLVAKREKLLAERGTLEDQYAAWLQPSPVDQWPIQDLRSLLDCLDRLRREDATAREATNQQASCQEKLGRYESRVERLASQLGFSPPTARHEVTAMQWLEKLQKMRDHRSERIRLQSAIDHHRQLIVELREREQALGGRIEETCKSFGIGDPASVESLMDRVQMAENWRRRLAELSIALDALRGNMSRQEFELQLAAAHETDLLLQTQEWSRQLEQYDEARKLADQQIGALTQQIEQLANNQAAQELLQSVQNQRGALAEMCEQWVVERLAQELLAKSIERFSAEHEPEMLQLTRQFFSQLTGGKYITIEHDPGQSERFYVRNQQEQSFEPGRLSTGTREQLYLAIRMAYITHYCEHHEPLPVVMDDCFVNFDEQRARLVLESIANWRDSLQTILLSCHWRVVQILAEVAPETRVIQLESGRTSSAEELVNEYSLN